MQAEETPSDINFNDVLEVIGRPDDMYPVRPYLRITEQPAPKALRFRYECEGRSAGSIPGVNSTPENKTFPAIEIVGHHGSAVVVISCVTKDAPYRPHPHNLVGKEGCNRGVYRVIINSNTMTFPNLGIQCVKKKDIEEALLAREDMKLDPFGTGFSHRNQPGSIDLNCVRLCFQAFVEGKVKGKYTVPLKPIVSDPIYDKKAMSDLTICKLSDCSASVAGGKEIILLCEKVAKEDIQVRFYEERDGELLWEGQGDFQPTHVHKQVAISFQTPKYRDIEIDTPVQAKIQLRRPSDGAVSESLDFQFIPLDAGRATFWSLHRALTKKGDYNTFSSILSANSGTRHYTEGQKRKMESVNPIPATDLSVVKKPLIERNIEVENKKDSLISGGSLVVLPKQQLTVYEKEPKVIGLNVEKGSQEPQPDGDLFRESEKLEKNISSHPILNKAHFTDVDADDDRNNNNVQQEQDKMVEAITDKKKEVGVERLKDITNTDMENSQSFNDLITQVAELDEIYSENKGRLELTRAELDGQLDVAMDCREIFDDSQTYTSLQLAMKNPVNPPDMKPYEDVVPVKGPIISVARQPSESVAEKLPPLPPKRAKRTPPRRPDSFPHSKTLPRTPDSKARPRQNIFMKLFSKKKGDNISKSQENIRDEVTTSPSAKDEKRKTSLDDLTGSKPGEGSFAKWFHRSSTGNIPDSTIRASAERDSGREPDNPENERGGAYLENYNSCRNDFDLTLDLTEAENYALYTAMAPHATASEFDEMSFYYSPVEGGKILTDDNLKSRIKDIDLKNLSKSQNVTT